MNYSPSVVDHTTGASLNIGIPVVDMTSVL